MPQKILSGRADNPRLDEDFVRVRVDQVILASEPNRVLAAALQPGLKRLAVETAVAYDTHCITTGSQAELEQLAPQQVMREAVQWGVVVARAGIGFPSAVHLERFAAPARLAITDDPRLAAAGGAGMLTLLASHEQIAEALRDGTLMMRPPRSVQILLSGKIRPFVCVRDLALELIRRGLREVIARIDAQHQAPVVLEFAGPSARLLSVPERALLCSIAPRLGAIASVFVSDEKTEVYLRDQRRSKAYRALVPDPGAPCEEVLTVDLSAIDPLLMDLKGEVRPVRDLDGEVVHQAVLGGDIGTALRDMLAAAALLKSKRVPPDLELLVASASRQMLEVMAQSSSLMDLIATGARLIEPDHRLLSGELYQPPKSGLSIRTYDPEPGHTGGAFIVASAETLAYAVATGHIGDPRMFKRPVRITVPRALPTEDVLVVRKQRGKGKTPGVGDGKAAAPSSGAPLSWSERRSLALVHGPSSPLEPSAVVLSSLDELSWIARRASSLAPALRVVIASYFPSGVVTLLSASGVMSLVADEAQLGALRAAPSLTVSDPGSWSEQVSVDVDGGQTLSLRWPAIAPERSWVQNGACASPPSRKVAL